VFDSKWNSNGFHISYLGGYKLMGVYAGRHIVSFTDFMVNEDGTLFVRWRYKRGKLGWTNAKRFDEEGKAKILEAIKKGITSEL
jgi:hypothetical protein